MNIIRAQRKRCVYLCAIECDVIGGGGDGVLVRLCDVLCGSPSLFPPPFSLLYMLMLFPPMHLILHSSSHTLLIVVLTYELNSINQNGYKEQQFWKTPYDSINWSKGSRRVCDRRLKTTPSRVKEKIQVELRIIVLQFSLYILYISE